jgi:O-antigen/teichoic acid export membrane protein
MSTPNRPAGTEDSREETEDSREESVQMRADRNLAELLQELRVAGLGVQVLFGFLLALPFSARFGQLGQAQRDLYVTDLVLAAVATVLLVGPVAYHRLVFRRHQKEHLIRTANTLAIFGLVAVALAISGAVLLIVSYVAPGAPAAVISICVVLLFASVWFALPLARRERRPPPPADGLSERANG